jgi:hypothetical protein
MADWRWIEVKGIKENVHGRTWTEATNMCSLYDSLLHFSLEIYHQKMLEFEKKKSWPFPFLTSWRSYDFYHSITISTLASQFRCGQLSNHSFHTLYICSIFFSPPSSVDPSISGERRLDQGSYPRIPAWVAGSGGVRSTDIWPYMQTSLPMYMCIF